MSLTGKVAFITGGARGIGAAICKRLARDGADIVFIDRDESAADLVSEEIKSLGRRALFLQADITKKEDVENAIKTAHEKFGSIDILVNNAGITRDNLFIRMKDEDWRAVIDINLTGAFVVTQAAAKIMLKQRNGSIINIASVIGLSGNAGQANYAAAKAGIIGLTKALAKEFSSRNIRVNAIAPGFVETDMTRALSESVREQARQEIPLGYFAEPYDIAATTAFLASEDARYITGQVIVVDGGMIT